MTMIDKNVVVTGASSGVDLAASILLAEQGARRYGLPRSQARLVHAQQSCEVRRRLPANYFLADLSSQEQI
jgi:NAD(P)-dependent dehydrogenase (short-subunit alcohol dehydrogenase family)